MYTSYVLALLYAGLTTAEDEAHNHLAAESTTLGKGEEPKSDDKETDEAQKSDVKKTDEAHDGGQSGDSTVSSKDDGELGKGEELKSDDKETDEAQKSDDKKTDEAHDGGQSADSTVSRKDDGEADDLAQSGDSTVSRKDDEYRNFHLHEHTDTRKLWANWQVDEDVKVSQDTQLYKIFLGLRFEWKVQYRNTRFRKGYPIQSPNPGSSLVHENTFFSGYIHSTPNLLRECLMRNLFEDHVLQGLNILDMDRLPKQYLAQQHMDCVQVFEGGEQVPTVSPALGVAARRWAIRYVEQAKALTGLVADQFFFRHTDRYDLDHADFAEEGMFFQVPTEFREVYPYNVLNLVRHVVEDFGIICSDNGRNGSSNGTWWCRNASKIRKTEATNFRIQMLVLNWLTSMSAEEISSTAQDGILKAVNPNVIPQMVNALYPILTDAFSEFMTTLIRVQAYQSISELIGNFPRLSDDETYGVANHLLRVNALSLEWITGFVANDPVTPSEVLAVLRNRVNQELVEFYSRPVPFGLSQSVEPCTIFQFKPSDLPSAFGFVEQSSPDPDQVPCLIFDLDVLGGSEFSQSAGAAATYNPLPEDMRICQPGCLRGLGVVSAQRLRLSGLVCPEDDPVSKENLIRKLILRFKP